MKNLREILEEQRAENQMSQNRRLFWLEEQLKEIIKVKIETTRKFSARLYPDWLNNEPGKFGRLVSEFVRKFADSDFDTRCVFIDRCADVGIKVSNLIPRVSKLPKFLRDWTHYITVEF